MSDDVNVDKVKANVKNVDTWVRGLFIVIYGIIFYALFWIIWLVVIFQFLMKVVMGSLNPNIMNFSKGLTRYAFQILQYVTFQSEERPWPFGPWPGAAAGSLTDESGAAEATPSRADEAAPSDEP
jgi:hypothetical protein